MVPCTEDSSSEELPQSQDMLRGCWICAHLQEATEEQGMGEENVGAEIKL